MAHITLITGGARSGKSAFALQLAQRRSAKLAFVATAVALDDEMRVRIERHRRERAERFVTVEEPLDIGAALARLPDSIDVAVVDCLTVWLGNLFHECGGNEDRAQAKADAFIRGLDAVRPALILVTNEVGWGIVPDNALARAFRDVAGRVNRAVAEKANTVYMVCAGIPLRLKGSDNGL